MYETIHYEPPKGGAFAPPLPPLNPPLVTTYSPWWTGLRKALTNQWNFIDTDPTLKKLFSEQPMIAYRRTRNIREYVSRAKLPTDAITCPSEIQPYSQQIDFPISRCNFLALRASLCLDI